jgi:hypothetical protein
MRLRPSRCERREKVDSLPVLDNPATDHASATATSAFHGTVTPSVLIDAKTRAFADGRDVTDAERDYVDTVESSWTSIRTYFR